MNLNKKIFFWSPILSHVGTIKAVEKSAEALKKYSNLDIYLINVFGEFDDLMSILKIVIEKTFKKEINSVLNLKIVNGDSRKYD